MSYIYRDVSFRKSKLACGNFINAVAISGATIVCSSSLSNGFSESKSQYWEVLFRVQFSSFTQLEKFHSFGIETTEPEKISGQNEVE